MIKLPKGEKICTQYFNCKGERAFILTQKELSQYYYLYNVVGGKTEKLGRGVSPLELEKKYSVDKVIRDGE